MLYRIEVPMTSSPSMETATVRAEKRTVRPAVRRVVVMQSTMTGSRRPARCLRPWPLGAIWDSAWARASSSR